MKNKILFWDSTVSDMKSGRKFGGIAVQLNFWMQIFQKNGWEIHTLAESKSYIEDNVNYHHVRHIKSIEIAWEWINIYRIVGKVRPQLIIFRGARRLLYPLSVIGHWFDAKVVMQGASDVNFEPGKASVGNRLNRRLYENALQKIDYIVCQNEFQAKTLNDNFNRDSLIIPNIWGEMLQIDNYNFQHTDVVWIGNFRRLKRPKWFFDAARALPNIRFTMAGGAADADYYKRLVKEADSIPNLDFLGQISIEESSTLISKAKILVCSSEYEGFPNTFLQAWAAGVPVVSTVDPNNLIATNNLGLTADSSESMTNEIARLLNDTSLYNMMQQSINNYFAAHHSSQMCYDELMNYISKNE